MPLLTLLSVGSLIILIMLGNWQYARYSDKMTRTSVDEQVAARSSLDVAIDRAHPGQAQQVYGFADSEPIWRRYAPGTLVSTGEPVLVMVEATGGAEAVPVALADLPETVRFEGLVAAKTASTSSFAAADEPERDIWYAFDPDAMAVRLGMEPPLRVAEPIIMTVRNGADMRQSRQSLNPYAFAKPVDPLPPERHFGYALTWWGMALGLIGVYVALHHSRGRLRFKKA
jgi:surfeit locus 1 family protein